MTKTPDQIADERVARLERLFIQAVLKTQRSADIQRFVDILAKTGNISDAIDALNLDEFAKHLEDG